MLSILIRNELFKIFKKKKTYFFTFLLIISCILYALIAHKYDKSQGIDWIASSEAQLEYFQNYIENAEGIEEDELENIKNQKACVEYALKNNISTFYITCYWKAVLGSMDVMIIAVVLIIILVSDLFCEEYSAKTLKMLFVRPNKREDIWLAKMISASMMFVIYSLIIVVTSLAIHMCFYNIGQSNQFIIYMSSEGIIEQKHYIIYFLQQYVCSLLEGVGYIFLTAMCAVAFKNAAASTTVSLIGVMGANTIIAFLEEKTEWVKYILFYNNDLSQYLNGQTTYWGTTVAFSIIVTIVYYTIFLVCSCLIFTKREVY